jgi:hypothetical protein
MSVIATASTPFLTKIPSPKDDATRCVPPRPRRPQLHLANQLHARWHVGQVRHIFFSLRAIQPRSPTICCPAAPHSARHTAQPTQAVEPLVALNRWYTTTTSITSVHRGPSHLPLFHAAFTTRLAKSGCPMAPRPPLGIGVPTQTKTDTRSPSNGMRSD